MSVFPVGSALAAGHGGHSGGHASGGRSFGGSSGGHSFGGSSAFHGFGASQPGGRQGAYHGVPHSSSGSRSFTPYRSTPPGIGHGTVPYERGHAGIAGGRYPGVGIHEFHEHEGHEHDGHYYRYPYHGFYPYVYSNAYPYWGNYGGYYDYPYSYPYGYTYDYPDYYDNGTYEYANPYGYVSPAPARVTTPTATTGQQYYSQALAAMRRGDYQQAARLDAHAIVEMPRDQKAHELMSLALLGLGQYDGAAAEAHAVLSLGPVPDWPTLYSFYQSLPTYTKQLNGLEKYVHANPSSLAGQFLLGYHDAMMGHAKEARQWLAAVVAAAPKDKLAARFLQEMGGPKAPAAIAESPAP